MNRRRRAGVVALGLTLGAAGCADLDVDVEVVLSEAIPTVATVKRLGIDFPDILEILKENGVTA